MTRPAPRERRAVRQAALERYGPKRFPADRERPITEVCS